MVIDRLGVGDDEDEVAAAVDAHAGAPNAGDPAERIPPGWAVRVCRSAGVGLPVPEDRSEALAGPRDVRPAPVRRSS